MTDHTDEATTMRLVHELAALARGADRAALLAARTLAQDFLSVAVAGSATPEGRIVADLARDRGRAGACSVVGGTGRYDPATAALVTATSGYSIGLTDTHARSITHPGPSVVPAALAVAQEVGASGEEFLRAVVTGCEAAVRVGSVVNPSHRRRGFHPTATCNVFGATIAAAQLWELDVARTAQALGIAGSMAGGLYEFRHEGSMLMALHGGWPAHNGIVAADLARRGFTGPSTVLEGPEGFFRAFADDIDLAELTIDPSHPSVLDIGLRPYNACRYGHSGIDALQHLADERGGLRPTEVRRMTVWTHRTAVDQETEATSVVGARLSTKFTVAWALAHGPKVDEVSEADLGDDVVHQIMERTDVREDPALTAAFPAAWACRVEVELEDGRVLQKQVDVPKGEPANPLSAAELSHKFHLLVDPIAGAAGADVLERCFADLVDAPGVDEVAGALSHVA